MAAPQRRSSGNGRPTAKEGPNYIPLPNWRPQSRTNEDFVDAQFEQPPPKFPLKSILMAIGMFLLGSLLIIIGSLLMVGIVGSATETDVRTLPLLFLGTILFIPGFYHVRIAYYAYKGYQGYDFSQIPDMDD